MEELELRIQVGVSQKGPEALLVQLVVAHGLDEPEEAAESPELGRTRGLVVW